MRAIFWGILLLLPVLARAEALLAVPAPLLGAAGFNVTTAAVAQRVEAVVAVDAEFANPYDPACVRLDALISGAAGFRIYPCFYMIPYDGGTNSAPARGEWRFRHAFRLEGEYEVLFRLWREGLGYEYSGTQRIVVSGRRAGGFVREEREHPGVWVRDDGRRFFATGINAGWFQENRLENYLALLDQCAAAGVAVARVWMVGFARQELEWSAELWAPWNEAYGLGRYNQEVAGFFDWLFAAAAARGVYIQLVLETHGEWSTEVDANWEFNPYSREHGGFLTSPVDFFTNERAIQLAQARYRYCVARWGAEQALAAWELFNEVDHTDAIRLAAAEADVARWHALMVRHIQRLDAVPRAVVSSAGDSAFLLHLARQAPELDRLDFHIYRDDAARVLGEVMEQWRKGGVTVALWCGEFGTAGELAGASSNQGAAQQQVRRMVWQGRMTGVPAWYWFWDRAAASGVFAVHRAMAEVFAKWDHAAERRLEAVVTGGPMAPCMTATPELGWGASTAAAHELQYDGATNAVLRGQSAYLQGAWNAARGRELSLAAAFAAEGAFEVAVSGVSRAGANLLVISVDGREAWRRPVAAGKKLLVRVGQGRHTLRLYNAGDDWIRLGALAAANLAAAPAGAAAVSDGARVLAYVADRRFLAGGANGAPLEGVALRLVVPERLAGAPVVRFVDPASGAVIDEGVAVPDGQGVIHVALPPFSDDLLVVLE